MSTNPHRRAIALLAAVILVATGFAIGAGAAQPHPRLADSEPVQDADAVLAELAAQESSALPPNRDVFEDEFLRFLVDTEEPVPVRVVLEAAERAAPSAGAEGDFRALSTRSDTTSKPVLLVHGRDNYDMGGYAAMRNYLTSTYGFSGGVHRVGYYGGECNVEHRAEHHGSHATHHGGSGEHTSKTGCVGGNSQVHDLDTDIRHIAYHLAWMIHDHFTKDGVVVDYVGHSMGGLLIRYALAKQGDAGFPSHLLVEDVVTMGTPHKGLGSWCWFSPWSDVRQMCSGSSFMTWLRDNAQDPQAKQWSTDWTVMGSDCDGWVGWDNAVGMNAAHKVVYVDPCYGHSDYYKDTTNTNTAVADWQDRPDPNWYRWSSAVHGVKWSAYAIHVGTW